MSKRTVEGAPVIEALCCGAPVIAMQTPEGTGLVLDAAADPDAPAAFVVTVDGRVIGWPEANPAYTGPRYRVHVCATEDGTATS